MKLAQIVTVASAADSPNARVLGRSIHAAFRVLILFRAIAGRVQAGDMPLAGCPRLRRALRPGRWLTSHASVLF